MEDERCKWKWQQREGCSRDQVLDFKRLVLASLALLCTIYITGIALVTTKRSLSHSDPLPDLIHTKVPQVDTHRAKIWICLMIAFGLTVGGVAVLLTPLRWCILYRQFFIYIVLLMLRNITVIVTSIPDPNPCCQSVEIPTYTIQSVFGEVFGDNSCGDLIYSGHTVALMFPTLVGFHYFGGWIAWVLLGNTMIGSVLIIVSRSHYTVDVLIAVVMTWAFFRLYHLYAEHPDLQSDVPRWLRRFYENYEWDGD